MSGAVPITFVDMEAYCALKGIYSLYERQRLIHFIDLLDRHWMAKHYEKAKKKEDTSATSDPRHFLKRPKTPRPKPRKRVS